MRYFLKLSYNGANYFGWQMQPNQISVQEVLTKALSLLLKENIDLTGAGRTDSGVHAREFYAHFDTSHIFTNENKADFVNRINSFLPQDIVVYDILSVSPQAHARFDALYRTYKYYVTTKKQPFNAVFTHRVFYTPDVEKMNSCCQKMMNYTDFTSFSKVHTQTQTNNCRITHAVWKYHEDNDLYIFEITADRFLRNMVRAIVGTLLDVGRGKLSIDDFCTIIEQKNRCDAGVSVPARALFLEEVGYEGKIWK